VGSGDRRGASTRDVNGLVLNVFNPAAGRDNYLQGAVDVIQMLRIPASASIPVAGLPGNVTFDSAHTYFFGHSQGSSVGIPALAVSNRTPAAILSGAGSYLTGAVLTRTGPAGAQATLAALCGGPAGASHA